MADNNSSGNQKPTLSWSQPAASAQNAKPAANSTPTAPANNKPSVSKSVPESSSSAGVYIGIFVAGLIVGALIGWGISASRQTTTSSTASSTAMTETSSNSGATTGGSTTSGVDLGGSTLGSSGNITVASPQPAGFAVAVTKASVSAPTWLVVYEDHSGVPGNAIGAELFFSGETSGSIELLRATLPGQSYFVGQSLDDGDKIFSLQSDKPVRDSKGNPLFTEFSAN